MPSPPSSSFLDTALEAGSALGTLLAAGFAAWSAWTSRLSAKAAENAVEEARRARKAETLPRLVLERDFLDFHFVWPHPSSLNGEAVFLARRHWRDDDPSPPTFSLSNYGAGPALELEIIFEFEDPNGPYEVPATFAPTGLRVSSMPTLSEPETVSMLQYPSQGGRGGAGLPLYRRWVVDIPSCAPGQTRKVDFPQHLLNTLFLRGLQYWERRGGDEALKEIVLTIRIACHTAEGDAYSTQFRFKANPFWQGLQQPLIVSGHFNELPMYPKSAQRRAE